MRLFTVLVVIYLSAAVAAQDSITASTTVLQPSTVFEPPQPDLQLVSAFSVAYSTEKVVLKCVIDGSSDWNIRWNRNNSEIHGLDFSLSEENSKLTITAETSAVYTCQGEHKTKSVLTKVSNPRQIDVQELPRPTLTRQSPWADVFETESVTFSCQVPISGWSFSWYKNGEKLGENTQLLSIDDVTKDNQGSYTCKVHLQSRHLSSKDSNAISLNVYSEKAKPQVTKSQSFETMYPGESIEFNCSVRVATDWIYMWYLNGSEIQGVNNHIYRIDKIDHSNHGQYFCKAKRDSFFSDESDKLSLQVSDPPQPSLKRLTSWSDVFEKEKVEMSCNVSDPTWTFTWYKDNKKLQKTSSLTWDEKGSKLTISSIAQDHRGNYACKANLALRGVISKSSIELHLTVYESLPLPKLAKNPDFNLMYVGENVAFTCKVSVSSGWEYKWYKDSDVLANTNQSITINLGLQHKGTYWCSASRGDISNLHSNKIRQDVEEIPVPELKLKNKKSDVFPKEMVQLSCMMPNSSGWTYTWYRDGGLIQADNNVVIGTNGATISFPSDPSLHQTQPYTCEAELKHRSVRSNFSSTVTLQVYDALPNVTLLQSPEHSLLHSGDSVSFSCNVDISSGWEFLWYKNGAQINKGNQHNISSAQVKDEGSYACRAERESFLLGKSEDMKIEVKERPEAEIILLTGWGEVLSTDSLVLQCKVKELDYKWNYTWFRGDVAVGEVPAEKYIVTPQNDPDQSQYSCKGIRSERPTYSKNSPLFKTKNLLLKRRILLSISGCLFFGIILAFLGCIYFKIRKPVVAEEKPEENELFLTLKKQLEHTDNPCPLVEYITDKALNEAPRESDGLISSDSTELTITTQEDQAAVSSATENGGAMISFQKVS